MESDTVSIQFRPTTWLPCSRYKLYSILATLVVLSSLPVIPVLNRNTTLYVHLVRSSDVITSETRLSLTSPPPNTNCVVTATSPAHPHHVLAEKRMAGGRLGNDMFVYASVVGIAAMNHMVPVYHCDHLSQTFHVTATGSDVKGWKVATSLVEESPLRYDSRFENLEKYAGDVQVMGFFQSWKYFRHLRPCVVNEFSFRQWFQTAADDFLRTTAEQHNVPAEAVYIGVHIRRGDMLYDPKYTVADVGYFHRAVHYMRNNFPSPTQLVFIVCTDDLSWSKEHFSDVVSQHEGYDYHGNGRHNNSDVTTTPPANKSVVVYSEGHSTEEDLAILSSCNHTIMTVGSFGWWGAYLAGGVTIYYRNWPKKNSELFSIFSNKDYFPLDWIGL